MQVGFIILLLLVLIFFKLKKEDFVLGLDKNLVSDLKT